MKVAPRQICVSKTQHVVWEDHHTSVSDIIAKMVDNERPFKDDVKFSYDTLSAKDSPTK